jgi:microcystin-dependent protein
MSKSWYRFMVDLWRRTGGGVDLISGTATTVVLNSPTGAMMLWQTATAPSGWLICNGAAVSRATYADLFSVIGTTNGAGDGSTTFNLPDFRDRLPIGLGASIATSLGATGGAATRTISQANLPNYSLTVTDAGHTHTFTGAAHNHAITDAGHTHTTVDHDHAATSGDFVTDAAGSEYHTTGGSVNGITTATTAAATVTVNSATTGITINNTTAGGTNSTSTTGITVASGGSGAALNVMNPTLCVNMIIKI